jgi:hypothetical protein
MNRGTKMLGGATSAQPLSSSWAHESVLVGGDQRRGAGTVDGDHDAPRRNRTLRAVTGAMGNGKVMYRDDDYRRRNHVCDVVRESLDCTNQRWSSLIGQFLLVFSMIFQRRGPNSQIHYT